MLVWLHGGGLSTGQGDDMRYAVTGSESPSPAAGDMYGPQFLIEYSLVIVTVNYRLGPLGQLSLDTGLVSGNQVQGGGRGCQGSLAVLRVSGTSSSPSTGCRRTSSTSGVTPPG